jgi:hypothetical protein
MPPSLFEQMAARRQDGEEDDDDPRLKLIRTVT